MYLESIEVEGLRGLREFKYTLEKGKVLLVYGLNGTGKSSLLQALKFAITGKLPPVSAVENSIPQVYRHKALGKEQPASVSVDFSIGSQRYWIKREIDYHGKIQTSYSDAEVPGICQSTANTFCFLTKNEFASMIDNVERDSWKRLSPFLGHEDISKLREGLRALSNSLKKDLAISTLEYTAKKEMANFLATKNEFDSLLNNAGLAECNFAIVRKELLELVPDLPDCNSYADLPWDYLEETLPGSDRIKEITSELQALAEEVAVTKITNLQPQELNTLESLNKLNDDLQLSHDLLHSQFLSSAKSAIEGLNATKCPLCGMQPNSWDQVRTGLRVRIDNLSRVAGEYTRAKGCLESYNSAVNLVLDNITEWTQNGPVRQELVTLQQRLRAFSDFIKLALSRINSIPPRGLTKDEISCVEQTWGQAQEVYLAYNKSVKAIKLKLEREQGDIVKTPELQRFNRLRRLAQSHIQFEEAAENANEGSKRLTIANDVIEKIQSFYGLVDDAETELNAQLLIELKGDVRRVFQTITDQVQLAPDIGVKTERGIRQAEIVITDFHGLGPVKARDYLSEANRNTLGLSIYFSGLLNRSPLLRTLVLDDITHASDNIHRRGLASFIVKELAERFQLIILTHDKNWHDRIASILPQGQVNSVKVIDWSPDGLTYQTDRWNTLLDKAADKLSKHDYSGGNVLRQALEKFMDEICERLRIEFPYRQSPSQISLNEKRERLDKAIKGAWKSGTGIIDPNTPAIRLLLNSQQITNLASHYGSFESWEYPDLKDALEDIKELLQVFVCKNLYSGLTCGGLMPSLHTKGGKLPTCPHCHRAFEVQG